MFKKIALSLALMAALPMAASASELDYTYIEGGYRAIDGDFGPDADGAYVKGSYNFGDSGFYAFGEYGWQDYKGFDFEFEAYDVGLGYHYGLSDRTDLIGEVAYTHWDGDFGFDADGYRVGVGLKSALTDRLEGLAQVNYRDNDFVDETTGLLGVRYSFNDRWSLNATGEFGSVDGDTYSVGVRYSF